MSNRIKILDPITANQIAAGEVVERPASVVKELVENAVDAGAGKIEVEVAAAGVELIRVTDNGCGMEREDAVLAFQRHATSKISNAADLGAIATLGFRGEALPSIASVSNMEVITRVPSDLEGTRLAISGGKVDQVQAAGCPVGTTFVVRDLFFNTPARRKFLKSDATELGQISDLINRMAMAYPGISFKFINQGRTLLYTSGNGNLLEAMSQVYGRELARQMIPVKCQAENLTLEGFLGRPSQTRSSRTHQTFFINGRFIRSKALTQAVAEGYHTLIPGNRYPLVVLNLELQPNLVDVNVHPTKLEVRFANEGNVVSFVRSAVQQALTGSLLIPGLESRQEISSAYEPKPIQYQATRNTGSFLNGGKRQGEQIKPGYVEGIIEIFRQEDPKPIEPKNLSLWDKSEVSDSPSCGDFSIDAVRVPESKSEPQSPQVGTSQIVRLDPALTPDQDPNQAVDLAPGLGSPEPVSDCKEIQSDDAIGSKLPDLQPLGQVDLTYIIAKGPDGLYVIDQHAAHERLNYEELWEKADNDQVESQVLLTPLTMDFTNPEMEILVENILQFSDLGLLLEHFGGNTFLLRGYPADIDDPQGLVRDLLDLFNNGQKTLEPRKLREEFIYMLACKSSIKANQRLNMVEMEHLIWRLGQAKNPFSCPHGRPTIIAISSTELAKRFQRV